MVEVCTPNSMLLTDNDATMKHPNTNLESFEFNLGQARNLRCVKSEKATVCGQCETCTTNKRLKEARDWLPKLGDHSKKRFMLGLLRRFHSVDLLSQIVTILQPLLYKDFTYARSRTAPSLATDCASLSSDRALDKREVESFIMKTWYWFQRSNYWTKSNYAISLLQMCDSHLLHTLGTQARTLLVTEERAASLMEDNDQLESASIVSTEHSFKADEHPELDLLLSATSRYDIPMVNPFCSDKFLLEDEIENDDSGDESIYTSELSSVDPACMVVPTSAKASSGVARHRDFIRSLPVHIAKYILGYLDVASLHNAVCVSYTWRILVEEVHYEFKINQDLIEEVMLMQGAAAQGANPVYAKDIDVFVPNLYPGTRQTIYTKENVVKAKFKSEVTFETAFSGISNRKVIMEERNVYCGSYNVMVLSTVEDPHRVIHTNGKTLIAVGSKDRKVRFIESHYGNQEGPLITGHAGSIRCVYLREDRGFVLSGSYDTSVRMWSLETGKCMRIFRGHRDTILTILVFGEYLISGSKDKCCKVWDLNTGKCQRTFKHRYPIWAVAMNTEMCITGCEGGAVKVWDIKTGELVKLLSGHHKQVTSIKFDKWHIITSSKDGYALVWSAQGNHNRCLNALRHPDEVLCSEFQYLRVITGCADGRLRIWNMVTGQCCRIMRGNSRSDPIEAIVANGDRITLNTCVNLLVLNFEKVEWDYSLDNDKVPPLVQYSSYSDAPVRNQPYSYIRAQRMVRAGATNLKILSKGDSTFSRKVIPQSVFSAPQTPHSAKVLSERCLASAKNIQTRPKSDTALLQTPRSGFDVRMSHSERKIGAGSVSGQKHPPPNTAPAAIKSPTLKTRPQTYKSGTSQHSVVIAGSHHGVDDADDDDDSEAGSVSPASLRRRVSWAFEKPLVPKSKDISLSETKALLRSQLRMKSESVVPPDFIYLTVNAIQSSMKLSEASKNTKVNLKDIKVEGFDHVGRDRPSSSPPKLDPKARLPDGIPGLEQFMPMEDDKVDNASEISDQKSVKSVRSKSKDPKPPPPPDQEIFATPCDIKPTKTRIVQSLHQKRTKTYVPRGRVIRPISASARRQEKRPPSSVKAFRPVTAPTLRNRPGTGVSIPESIASTLPGAGMEDRDYVQQRKGMRSSGLDSNIVPMLMYPAQMKEKINQTLKDKRKQIGGIHDNTMEEGEIGAPLLGKVSQFNDPMRSHVKFELRTYEQERDYLQMIEKQFFEQLEKEEAMLARKRRAAWLAKAKLNLQDRPGSQPPIKIRPKSETTHRRTRPMSEPVK